MLLKQNGYVSNQINILLTTDAEILQHNITLLKHYYFTDIITIPYTNSRNSLSADIIISLDTVIQNSKRFNTSFQTELLRVFVHGLLHLFGYTDKTKGQKLKMRALENNALDLFKALH